MVLLQYKNVYDIDTDFFYHLCCGTVWSSGSNKAVKGLTLNKATLSEKVISLPIVSEQRAIAAELDKIDDIIDKTHDELELLDQLVKSRFVEMFENYEYPKVNLSEVCDFITKGTTPAADEMIEYTAVRNFAQGEEEWASHRDSATMDVA